ncbi:hypothetical protein ES708_27692 [subsurface metagenome]
MKNEPSSTHVHEPARHSLIRIWIQPALPGFLPFLVSPLAAPRQASLGGSWGTPDEADPTTKTIMICSRCRNIMAYIRTTDDKPRRGLCSSCLTIAIDTLRKKLMAIPPIPATSNLAVPRQVISLGGSSDPGGPTQGSLLKPHGALGSPFPR